MRSESQTQVALLWMLGGEERSSKALLIALSSAPFESSIQAGQEDMQRRCPLISKTHPWLILLHSNSNKSWDVATMLQTEGLVRGGLDQYLLD